MESLVEEGRVAISPLRGREMAHQHLGMQLLERVKTDFEDVTKIELEPKLEGRQMTMVLALR